MLANGTLDREKISRVLLQLRNTPDIDTKVSPAKAPYGRELEDFLPRPRSSGRAHGLGTSEGGGLRVGA